MTPDSWYVDELYFGSSNWPSWLEFRINRVTEEVQWRADEENAPWEPTTRENYESWAQGAWRGQDPEDKPYRFKDANNHAN